MCFANYWSLEVMCTRFNLRHWGLVMTLLKERYFWLLGSFLYQRMVGTWKPSRSPERKGDEPTLEIMLLFFPQLKSVSGKMLPIINYHQLTVEWFRNPANHHQLREVGSQYPVLHPRVLGSSQDLTSSVLPRKLWKGRTACIFLVTCGYGKEG